MRYTFQKVSKLFLLVLLSTSILVSCGGETAEKSSEPTVIKKKKKKKKDERPNLNKDFTSSENDGREVVKVEITGNDLMKYDKAELKVPAGTRVELTLKHSGQMRWDAMGHNVVILKPDTDVAAFCQRAIGAKKNDYIPSDDFDEIIAHTAMIGGGETSIALFDAPEKGTYDFVCSFPGHYAFMKGKFIVE